MDRVFYSGVGSGDLRKLESSQIDKSAQTIVMKKLPLSAKTEIEESILSIRKLDVNLLTMYSPLRISFSCLIITLIIALLSGAELVAKMK